jgi:UDP-3-O-[3-hydroxymyristoyl] N-acetylglucosamine deacetylase
MKYQRTIREARTISGQGLHGGKPVTLTLRPSGADTGIVFVRTDAGGVEIPARAEFSGKANYATVLQHGGARISTIEHLLAALYALGVDNVRAELDSDEVPILDGSASPWVDLVLETGLVALDAPRLYIVITRPIEIEDGEKKISVHPAREYRVTYAIDFDHPNLGFQELTVSPWGVTAFRRMLAPARTFVLEKEVESLRRAGLARGGSLDNAVVVGEAGVLNERLRFPDEFVRHKMLDLTGDLALLGRPLCGHVIAFRAGHDMHGLLVQRILARADDWVLSPWAGGQPVADMLMPAGAPDVANTRRDA